MPATFRIGRRMITHYAGKLYVSYPSLGYYRKKHDIVGSLVGSVSGYVMRIRVFYGSGTDSGENVYLDGKCRPDFGDVRFTASDGTTELPYWMEYKVDGNYATFWVRIPSIPTSPAVTTMYIYYGDLNKTYAGDGNTTFEFFDDFLTLDTSKWNYRHGLYRVVDGTVEIGYGTVIGGSFISALFPSLTSFVLGWRGKTANTSGEGHIRVFFSTSGHIDTYTLEFRSLNTGGTPNAWSHAIDVPGGGSPDAGVANNLPHNTWKYFTAIVNNLNYVFIRHPDRDWWSNEVSVSYTDSTFRTKTRITLLGQRSDAFGYIVCDWIFVRKYISPEPTHGTWYPEEAIPSLSLFPVADI